MTLEQHARRELELAGLFDEDSDYGGMLGHSTMRLIEAFAAEGHSGMSAAMQDGGGEMTESPWKDLDRDLKAALLDSMRDRLEKSWPVKKTKAAN
ncbi:MAG: hypothetical protein GTN75_00095 [Gemmatimonadetes bacterium]|nr:hypothetical protein [Gemmatimonadota bacterium]